MIAYSAQPIDTVILLPNGFMLTEYAKYTHPLLVKHVRALTPIYELCDSIRVMTRIADRRTGETQFVTAHLANDKQVRRLIVHYRTFYDTRYEEKYDWDMDSKIAHDVHYESVPIVKYSHWIVGLPINIYEFCKIPGATPLIDKVRYCMSLLLRQFDVRVSQQICYIMCTAMMHHVESYFQFKRV